MHITTVMRNARGALTARNRHPYAACDRTSYLFGRDPPSVNSTQMMRPGGPPERIWTEPLWIDVRCQL
jgi:hypothetical protein